METGGEDLLIAFSIFSWPELAVLGGVFCSVYGWVLLRVLVKDKAVSPTMANGSSMLIGGIFALAHSYCIESWQPFPVEAENFSTFFQIALLMTGISTILCYNLYGMMLKKLTATLLSFLWLLSPIFASLISWVLLGEAPSMTIIYSTAIVCIGSWLVYRAELRQGYISKSKENKTLVSNN